MFVKLEIYVTFSLCNTLKDVCMS